MTKVLNMLTGNYSSYTLSPFQAVVSAYAFFEKRNYNTWTYEQYHPLVTITESVRPDLVVVTLGNQCCLAVKGRERAEYGD